MGRRGGGGGGGGKTEREGLRKARIEGGRECHADLDTILC